MCKHFRKLPLAVAAESRIYGDAAYTDYTIEDDVKETEMVELMIQRRSNAKRKDETWVRFIKEQMRKVIEMTFSESKALFLRTLHAVTSLQRIAAFYIIDLFSLFNYSSLSVIVNKPL